MCSPRRTRRTCRRSSTRASPTGPELFATNTLVIAMPKGNPGGVEDLSDLGDDSVTVVLCAPEVPCGAASADSCSRTRG